MLSALQDTLARSSYSGDNEQIPLCGHLTRNNARLANEMLIIQAFLNPWIHENSGNDPRRKLHRPNTTVYERDVYHLTESTDDMSGMLKQFPLAGSSCITM